MSFKFKIFVLRVKLHFRDICLTYCYIHHEALMIKMIPVELKNVLNLMAKILNYVKSRTLENRLLKKNCCQEADFQYETFVLHCEI